MFSKDVQRPRASQPLCCENQCQKVTTTKMLKQNSPCKHSFRFNLRRKKWQDLKSFPATGKTQEQSWYEPAISCGSQGYQVEEARACIQSTSPKACVYLDLFQKDIFLSLWYFTCNEGEKKTLQNYYRSNVLSQIQLKSEIISELF